MSKLIPCKGRSVLLFILFSTIVLFYCSATLFMPAAPIVTVKIAGSQFFAGLPGAIFLLAGAASAPVAAKRMNKHGRLNILRIALSLGILGATTCYFGDKFVSLLILLMGFTLLGVSGAVIILSRVMITEMFALAEQPKVMGYVFLGAVVGGILGPIVGYLSTEFTFERSILAWTVSAVLFTLALVLSFIPKRDSRAIASDLTDCIRTTAKTASISNTNDVRSIFYVIMIGALGHALMVSMMSIIGTIMKLKGIEFSLIFLGMGLHFIGMFGTMPISARIYTNFGFEKTLYAALVIYFACFFGLMFANVATHFIVCLVLLGAGWSLCFLSATMMISSMCSMDQKVNYMAKNDLYSALSGAILTVVAGLLLQQLGQQGVAALMLLFLPIIFIGIIFVSRKSEVKV